MLTVVPNRYRKPAPRWATPAAQALADSTAPAVHQSLAEYAPTPLLALPTLARTLGLGRILVKDEGQRFSLKAFKALGAAYAVSQWLCLNEPGAPEPARCYHRQWLEPGRYTFCTATDGNHGRGVAWVARKLRQQAVIFMPANTVPARIENIRAEGAQVVVVDGTYDDAVLMAAAEADRHGWQVISDTSWPGYEQIPAWIQAGYVTLFQEIDAALPNAVGPDYVFVQGGVGALAAAAAWYYARTERLDHTKLVCVEPVEADCLLRSAQSPDGSPTPSPGRLDSVMAGLNCGTASPIAWPFIRDRFDYFVAISDNWAHTAMRRFHHPGGGDPQLVSGESGCAGLAALLALVDDPTAAARIGLSSESTVLLLNTEADTNPASYRQTTERA